VDLEKEGIFFLTFSDNYGYFSLLQHQNSTNGSFLKINSNVKSETMSVLLNYKLLGFCVL
jgi:hypothetical protein